MEIKNYIGEVWKDIKGYEGLYQVSNFGRVKSIRKYSFGVKIKIMRYSTNPKTSYHTVRMCINKKITTHYIHRLVAEAFLPNPDNLPVINHKDENPSHNFVWVNDDGTVDPDKSNLEWCTYSYNVKYGTCLERITNKTMKPVLQFSLSGEHIKEYKSAKEAEIETGISCSNICICCQGKGKSAGGFIWKFKNPPAA